jgi:hypothetical protein
MTVQSLFFRQVLRSYAIAGYVWMQMHHRNGSGLFCIHPTDSHQSALTVKSTRQNATHPKTEVVVAIIARVVVANGGAAILGIVVPGTAAQQLCCPPQVYFILDRSWVQELALTLNPSPEGRGTLNLAPFSLGRRVGDEG